MKFGPSGPVPKTKEGNGLPKESSLHGARAVAKISPVVTTPEGRRKTGSGKCPVSTCVLIRGCFIPARFLNATAGLGSNVTL